MRIFPMLSLHKDIIKIKVISIIKNFRIPKMLFEEIAHLVKLEEKVLLLHFILCSKEYFTVFTFSFFLLFFRKNTEALPLCFIYIFISTYCTLTHKWQTEYNCKFYRKFRHKGNFTTYRSRSKTKLLLNQELLITATFTLLSKLKPWTLTEPYGLWTEPYVPHGQSKTEIAKIAGFMQVKDDNLNGIWKEWRKLFTNKVNFTPLLAFSVTSKYPAAW